MWSHWECDWDSTELAWESSRYFVTPPLISREMTSEQRLQKFHTDVNYTDLDSAPDWLDFSRNTTNQKQYSNLGDDKSSLFPWCLKPLFQSEAKCEAINMKMVFKGFALRLVLKVRFIWNSEMAYFCSRCSDVISQGNHRLARERRLFTQARLKPTLYKGIHNFS